MNETLAKQLHDVIQSHKLIIDHEIRKELDDLEENVKQIIEEKLNEKI